MRPPLLRLRCALLRRGASSAASIEQGAQLVFEASEAASNLAAFNSSHTLCLNADYTPMSTTPLSLLRWKDAVRIVFQGRANVVSEYEHLVARSTSMAFPLPSVIALKSYQPVHRSQPALTRQNVFLRDGFRCSFCGELHAAERLTLDHVVPKCKGGLTVWTNVTTACVVCNQKKGSASLKDLRPLGMRLRTQPRAPTAHDLQSKRTAEGSPSRVKLHPHWESFCIAP